MTSFRDYHLNSRRFCGKLKGYAYYLKPPRSYTLNSVVSHCSNQSARNITEFCCVNMDARYYSVVHSTWPSPTIWQTHAPTFNKWHKKKKKKKVTLHILTHDAMQGCGSTSLMVRTNDKFRDTRERNVIIRSDIWTTNIRSLGFRDIRECDIMKVAITELRVHLVAARDIKQTT